MRSKKPVRLWLAALAGFVASSPDGAVAAKLACPFDSYLSEVYPKLAHADRLVARERFQSANHVLSQAIEYLRAGGLPLDYTESEFAETDLMILDHSREYRAAASERRALLIRRIQHWKRSLYCRSIK